MSNSTNTMLLPSEMKQGRKFFNAYQAITCFSFPLVNGSIITLYAIKIGASASLIGILASFNYLSFIMVPIGKALESRVGAGRVFALGQVLRYIAMLPILSVPFFYGADKIDSSYFILTAAYFGFNFFRGAALIGQNPVTAMIVNEKQRSRYIAVLMMINFVFTILAYLVLAAGLKFTNNSMLGYNILISLGILTGFISAYYLFRLPNTPVSAERSSIWQTFKAARLRWPFKRFIFSYFWVSFVMGLTRPYIIVYAKQVYGQSDSTAILLTTIGTLGSLIMAAFSRTIINLVGGKTLYIFLMSVATISLLPAVVSPMLAGTSLLVFLAVFNFVSTFGMQGVESNSQTYLFTVIRKDEIINLSIVYYIVYGIAGAAGSTLGGFLIDLFPRFELDIRTTFQLLFTMALIGYVVTLYILTRLQNTSKHSVRDGLGFILSPKDIKAISLANQLESSVTPAEQMRLLQEIARSDSDAPIDLLIESLKSPKLFIRRQALFTLESIPETKDPALVKALLLQLHERQYTTGYMAARVLGRNRIRRAVPHLRRMLNSDDHYLIGESIRALARLDDKASIPVIYNFIMPNRNIYVIIQAINALENLLDAEEVSMLFRPFRWPTLRSESIGNETVLSIASLLGLEDWFYSIYVSYTQAPGEGFNILKDLYYANKKKCGTNAQLERLLTNPDSITFRKLSLALMQEEPLFFAKSEAVQMQLQNACGNPVLFRHRKVRFLFTALLTANHIHVEAKKKQSLR
jgi:hypothetical protein